LVGQDSDLVFEINDSGVGTGQGVLEFTNSTSARIQLNSELVDGVTQLSILLLKGRDNIFKISNLSLKSGNGSTQSGTFSSGGVQLGGKLLDSSGQGLILIGQNLKLIR